MAHSADFVFRDGPVYSGDSARTWARAVAVLSGRIVAVGGEEQVLPLAGPDTEVVDLKGRLLCAGFQDAHVHPITAGMTLLRCNLLDATGAADTERRISEYAATHPSEPWIRGGGWRFTWFENGMPPAALLDRLVPDRPAYLRVADGHAGWANSLALQAAGITAATADPADGRIERLADGSPQGTLQEGAMDLVERVLPANGADQLDRGLAAAERYLLSLGVTAWQDAWVTDELHGAYVRAGTSGTLVTTVRGALWWDRDGGLEQLDAFEARRDESVGRYRAGSVKLMLDGICENYTAKLLEPYLDQSGALTANRGMDFIDPTQLAEIVTELMRRGLQPHFHSLGDGAVRNALDAVAAARSELGWTDVRPHIAHIQVVDPADLPRFRELGVIANAQPLWACADDAMNVMTVPFLGDTRADLQYPFRDLLRHGATLAMGSDWSVSTPNVMHQIDVAVNRKVLGEKGSAPFLPWQRISVADALSGFTSGSAYVNHLETTHGSVEVGKVGDLVVLESDPFATDDIAAIRVDLTMVDGAIVYNRAGS